MAVNQEVHKRIAAEKEKKTGFLDLRDMGLNEIPNEILDLQWLQSVNLSTTAGQTVNSRLYPAIIESYNNVITEIGNLDLPQLRILHLENNQISEIKNLHLLPKLEELYLSTNEITGIKNLETFANLRILDLSLNPITELYSLRTLINKHSLEKLYLYGIKENNLHIPAENFGSSGSDNCLPFLRAYFESIKKGAAYTREVPVILVGNSTAGKTSLLHFIKERTFPPPKDHSTHGIEPDLWHPPQSVLNEFPDMSRLKDVQFYFWDFGGQEYYHATHRMFFSPRAVYVLVWDKLTNKQGTETIPVKLERANGQIEEIKQPVELFPYSYWLDTIRFFAPDEHAAPIIVVQNKLDTSGYIKERPADVLFKRFGICEDVFYLSLKEASHARPNGKPYRDFKDFTEFLFSVAGSHINKMARETHWEGAKNLLRQYRDDNIWSTQELLSHLQLLDADINEGSMQSYAYSLCSNGFIFYYPEIEELKNCVFINPAWVTKTIYDILDKEVLANGGVFDLQKVAAKAGTAHVPAFIGLMKKFELIFEDPGINYFIAPQYLPSKLEDTPAGKKEWDKLKVRFNNFAAPDYYLRFPDFMPRSIMLRFLAVYGAKAIGQNYWKNGIAFMIEGKEAVVLYSAALNGVKIFVEDNDRYVQRLILDTLLQLASYKQTLQIGLNAEDFVQYSELKKYYKNTEVGTVTGKMVTCAPLQHFVSEIQILKSALAMNDKTNSIKLFISYAHEDTAIKDLLVDTHLKAIQNYYADDVVAWTDAGIKPGADWDNIIKKEMAEARIIVFLITSSFLASDYIKKTEIKNALERFKNKQQLIVPLYIEGVSKKLLPFKEKQYLPGGTPLKKWRDKSDAWVKIQDGIIALIDDIKAGNTSAYFE